MRTKLALKAKEIKSKRNREFYEVIKDIIHHPVVQLMKKYPHHADTSCFRHCMNVAYFNYQICKFFHLDAVSAARAGMLHDLFLYDWHFHTKETGDHFHAMTHPRKALENAEKYFQLNEMERDIIQKHMWPLTVIPPKYWESFITGMTDKLCGALEVTDFYLRPNSNVVSYCKDIRKDIEPKKKQSY